AARRAYAAAAVESGDKSLGTAQYLRLYEEQESDAELLKALLALFDQLRTSPYAEAVLLKLTEVDKSSSEAFLRLAEMAEAEGDLAKAEHRLGSARDRSPKDVAVALRLARFQSKREEWREALE